MDDVNDYELDLRVSLTVTVYAAVWLSHNAFFIHFLKGRKKYD